MPVNVNMGAVSGNHREVDRHGRRPVMPVKPVHQTGHQPGGPAGINLISEGVYVVGVPAEGLPGMLKTFLSLPAPGLQPGHHVAHL